MVTASGRCSADAPAEAFSLGLARQSVRINCHVTPKVFFILVGGGFCLFFVPTVAGRFFHNGASIPPTPSLPQPPPTNADADLPVGAIAPPLSWREGASPPFLSSPFVHA